LSWARNKGKEKKMKNSFKNLTFPELKVKRDELNRKYMELRFQMVIGHVENPLLKRTMRRQIARLNTLICQHELASKS
jgi:large subunit ribosomal protein L29